MLLTADCMEVEDIGSVKEYAAVPVMVVVVVVRTIYSSDKEEGGEGK
jgi:hypothetical protein